jgi:hypothetical protein
MKRAPEETTATPQCPPEQVTLVYCNRDGAHSFSILEVPGLIVLDHDMERAFNSGVAGAGRLISSVCQQSVEYAVAMSFDEFKQNVDKQAGTANTHRVVAVPGKIHRGETRLAA